MSKTCIIIPCYNEAARLECDVLLKFLETNEDIDFCFVNDGSLDKTVSVLNQMFRKLENRITIIDNRVNQGKAESVRCGMNKMSMTLSYDYVGFIDADLATPLEEVVRLIAALKKEKECIWVMGSRVQRMGVEIERKMLRHYMGRLFATIISVLFKLRTYDTQCGAKFFKTDFAKEIFRKPFFSKWLFDVELLLRTRRLRSDYNMIVKEIPLNVWIEKGDSKIRFSHFLKMPVELWRMYFRYKN